jgi:hypothetical protein
MRQHGFMYSAISNPWYIGLQCLIDQVRDPTPASIESLLMYASGTAMLTDEIRAMSAAISITMPSRIDPGTLCCAARMLLCAHVA